MSFGGERGHAIIETERFKIRFEGVPFQTPNGGDVGVMTTSFNVAGGGPSEMSLTKLDKRVQFLYRNGINTIQLDDYKVELLDGGRTLRIADATFDLRGEKKMILVGKDGRGVAQ